MKHNHATRVALSLALAGSCLCALADSPAPAPAPKFSPHGSALVISLGASGGLLAPGAAQSFRVFNGSPRAALTDIRATATAKSGFKVASTTCGRELPSRGSCEVNVVWIPRGADATAAGTLSVSALNASGEPIAVTAGLSGDVAAGR